MRRALAAVATAALAAVAVLPAAAQPLAPAAVRVQFESISPWVAPDRPFGLSMLVAGDAEAPIEDLFVRVSFFGAVGSRSELRAALDGRVRRNVVAVTTEDLPGPLVPGRPRRVRVERSLGEIAGVFRPPTARGGVYPVEIRLEDPRRTLGTWYAAVPFFAGAPPSRLNVVPVWSVDRPLRLAADGEVDGLAMPAELAPLADGVQALLSAQRRSTVSVSGSFLDALVEVWTTRPGDDAVKGANPEGRPPPNAVGTPPIAAGAESAGRFLAMLRDLSALPSIEVAATTYARADITDLLRAGLRADARRQVVESSEAFRRALGVPPSPGVLVPPRLRLDPAAAILLAGLGVRRVVLDPALLSLPTDPGLEGSKFGTSRPVRVEAAPGVTLEALVADPDIRQRLGSEGDPVLLAQGAVAETASSWFELPLLAGARLLVITSDALPSPAATRTLLSALASAPWLRMRTATEALDALRPADEPLEFARVPGAPPRYLTTVRTVRRLLDRLESVVIDPAAPLERLNRLLLRAQSADWVARPSEGVRIARAAQTRARQILGAIRSPRRFVTLTSRTGAVPITVLNDSGFDARVVVALSSAKVAFPEGSTRTVDLHDRVTTLTFPIESRATGNFPIRVAIRTPAGRLLGSSEVIVRSTAVSAVTLAATGGGALFLIGAWSRRVVRRRRAS